MSLANKFISALQRTYFMPEALNHVSELVRNVPALRVQHDDIEHMAYLHYVDNHTDAHWYITELDIDTMQAFGYITGLGYTPINMHKLLNLPDVGLDTRFKPCLVSEVNHAR